MYTYQDLLAIGDDEKRRKDFVQALINDHKNSPDYKIAEEAYEYYCHRNVTIREYQKLLYTVTGQAIPDNYSANYKMACRHFHRFLVQEVQYLLGNGVSWTDTATEDKLGTRRKSFDSQLKKLAKASLWGKVAFGYWAYDHLEVFTFLEFAPLYDETNGALMAGVRFWQIDKDKPLRATLYEPDGFTRYVWNVRKDVPLEDSGKESYIKLTRKTEAEGIEIYDGENYPTFPIVPLWGNDEHQSEIVGLREQIDCYDLIKSGFANTVDEASYVYWTIQNAGGMSDVDLAKFVKRMMTVHAAVVADDGASAESHSQEAPYASREALLDRLEKDMYKDAMALDTDRISDGAVTATQIIAAYEDLNAKCDDFEYNVLDFIEGILAVAGLDDEASFTRSQIINREEGIQLLIQAAPYLTEEYVTTKILEMLGDGDKVEDIIAQITADGLGQTEPAEPVIEE